MSVAFRRLLLRFNGAFLIVASLGALIRMDFPGAFGGTGPLGPLIAHEPSLAIGVVEAHGLALILGVLIVRAQSSLNTHLTGAAIHLLLGGSNILFWQIFVVSDMVPVGYVTTILHGVLFLLHVVAALIVARLPAETTARAAPF